MKQIIQALVVASVLICGCHRSAQDYLQKGNERFAAGKLDDAMLDYRKAIQKDPNLGEAYYRLGLVCIRQNQSREAFQTLSRAVTLMPENEEAMAKLADVGFAFYLADSRRPKQFHDTAETMSEKLLAKNPQSFDGLRLKGNLSLLNNRPKQAVEFLEKANQVRPMDQDVIQSLSQALILENRFDEAEKVALAFISKEKTFGPLYDVLYRQYLKLNRPADAERILAAKASNNPGNAKYALELAEHFRQAKEADKVRQTVQRLIDDPKTFPTARLQVGDFYARAGNWKEARVQFDEGMRANPKEKAVYQIRTARVAVAQDRMEEAIQILDTVLKEGSDNLEALNLRSMLLVRTRKAENVAAAVVSFKELVRRQPDDVALRFNLAMACLLSGDIGTAASEFQEVIRRQKSLGEAQFFLATTLLIQNKPAEALRHAEELLAKDPGNPQIRLLHSRCLMRIGRFGEAGAELSRLSTQFPSSPEIQLQLGLLAVFEKKFGEAERIFGRLRQSGKADMRTTAALVEVYAGQHEFNKALELLSTESNRTQNQAVSKLLAQTAMRARKFDVATTEYERLLREDHNSAELHVRLGEVSQAKGDLNSAIGMFRQARTLTPKDPEAAVMLAEALIASGKTDEALAVYRDISVSAGDDAVILNNLAYLLCETGGNLDDALKKARRAVDKVPGDANFKDTLGWVYLKKGMNDSALQVFRSLTQKNPENPTFRYHLGAALLTKGDRQQARKELETALAGGPSPLEARKIRELLKTLV